MTPRTEAEALAILDRRLARHDLRAMLDEEAELRHQEDERADALRARSVLDAMAITQEASR